MWASWSCCKKSTGAADEAATLDFSATEPVDRDIVQQKSVDRNLVASWSQSQKTPKSAETEDPFLAAAANNTEDFKALRLSECLIYGEDFGSQSLGSSRVKGSPRNLQQETQGTAEGQAPNIHPPAPIPEEVTRDEIELEPLRLSGRCNGWALDTNGLLFTDEGVAEIPRQRLCVKLTSGSLSFQIVSNRKHWDWRLYPANAKLTRMGLHASKEGCMQRDDIDGLAVAHVDLKNAKAAHGKNFHIIEPAGSVVTIFVEQRAKVVLNSSNEGTRVWYTRSDTGFTFAGGDGIDLSRYTKWIPGLGG